MTTNYFTVDFISKAIIGTKTNIKKAGRIGSPQYKELCEVMALHATFSIVAKEIKKNESKKTYHGLTLAVMEEYINTQPDKEKMLVKFAAVQRIAETKGSKYPLTKKWFLNTFPAYKVNEVAEDEAKTLTVEIAVEMAKKKAAEEEAAKARAAAEAEAAAELEVITSNTTDKIPA